MKKSQQINSRKRSIRRAAQQHRRQAFEKFMHGLRRSYRWRRERESKGVAIRRIIERAPLEIRDRVRDEFAKKFTQTYRYG